MCLVIEVVEGFDLSNVNMFFKEVFFNVKDKESVSEIAFNWVEVEINY